MGEPINHANPVIEDLFRQDIYTGDVSLTIEHEGRPGDGLTDAQLERSAQICAYWCDKFNIPADRSHIIGHYEIGPHKYCPGQLFPFDRLVARDARNLERNKTSGP
jgi:N-acetyl-anhydromuramyl-L-alanine amidase AmpD